MTNNKKTKILIICAHPELQKSAANQALCKVAKKLNHVTFVDLYAEYPHSKIDVQAENKRLQEHDILIFQFPLYWYSSPALLKEWQDVVLVEGQTYGPDDAILNGKKFLCAVTAGVAESEFTATGSAGIGLATILCPIEQTFKYCGTDILPPFLWYEAPLNLAEYATQYENLLITLGQQNNDSH